tara:strand:- start:4941 stop:5372 length:432 start_codon:yes stop_codon:yes gene_type:complete
MKRDNKLAAYGLLRPYNNESKGAVYGYSLWNTGAFPVAMQDHNYKRGDKSGNKVVVECLNVDYETLTQFDFIENEGIMYKRVEETMYYEDESRPPETVFFYAGIRDYWKKYPMTPKIPSGDWEEFNRQRIKKLRGGVNMELYS